MHDDELTPTEEIIYSLIQIEKNMNIATNLLESILGRLEVIEERNITFNINTGKVINQLKEILTAIQEEKWKNER